MDLQNFNSVQEIISCKNPIRNKWIIAIDIGFSSVKAMSPNKRYCFPSFVKKIESKLMATSEDDIYYKDDSGIYLVGVRAQDLVRADDTNDTKSFFDRDRYYTNDFIILSRVAVAIGLMNNEERQRTFKHCVQTGLPAAYLKEDAPKIKAAFTKTGEYEVKIGTGKWIKYENTLSPNDVFVMSQPTGTLNSVMFDDNGDLRESAKPWPLRNILIADFGFGTFDPFGVINGERVLEESIDNLGMKQVLEVAADYVYKDYKKVLRIPQMRKCMRDGYVKIVDVPNMISKKVELDSYIEKACHKVADIAIKKLYEVANYFKDYDLLIITGGTGAAWFEIFKEKLADFEGLEVIAGNDGSSIPMYMANVRGYYMSAYRRYKN